MLCLVPIWKKEWYFPHPGCPDGFPWFEIRMPPLPRPPPQPSAFLWRVVLLLADLALLLLRPPCRTDGRVTERAQVMGVRLLFCRVCRTTLSIPLLGRVRLRHGQFVQSGPNTPALCSLFIISFYRVSFVLCFRQLVLFVFAPFWLQPCYPFRLPRWRCSRRGRVGKFQ